MLMKSGLSLLSPLLMHPVCRLAGMRAIVFNGRGTSDGPVTTPKFYSASFTGDMRYLLRCMETVKDFKELTVA